MSENEAMDEKPKTTKRAPAARKARSADTVKPTQATANGSKPADSSKESDADSVDRAEQIVATWGTHAEVLGGEVARQLIRLGARAREGVEDILAEAQELQRNWSNGQSDGPH
ncbi:MAG TPA: hypothetical protein VHV31_13245 [Nitrolancea sp.]|jgi:hypothetical protein|nr:hypothetical protein [Nitrolancea sp.]